MTKFQGFISIDESDLTGQGRLHNGTLQFVVASDGPNLPPFMQYVDNPRISDAVQALSSPAPRDCDSQSRDALLRMRVHTIDPVWSSELLNNYVRGAMLVPGGLLTNVFVPLMSLLGQSHTPLSVSVGQFIKEIVILCFTRYRAAYDAIDWAAFINAIPSHPTQSQLYLADIAVPPDRIPAHLASEIANKLAPTRNRPLGVDAVGASR